eukprot:scaffold23992_cov95-Isochrysis_galbana.AAC.2
MTSEDTCARRVGREALGTEPGIRSLRPEKGGHVGPSPHRRGFSELTPMHLRESPNAPISTK